MIAVSDLLTIAKERLSDAEALLIAERYDGAVYLCGYAVEIALKHRICLTLNWDGFPQTNKEFENYRSLKTHDLVVLLNFTGISATINKAYLDEWSAVVSWNPESRYQPASKTIEDAERMVSSAKTLFTIL